MQKSPKDRKRSQQERIDHPDRQQSGQEIDSGVGNLRLMEKTEEGGSAEKSAAPSFPTEEMSERSETEGISEASGMPVIRDMFSLYGMKTDLRTYSPLALAFLGDAVYSLFIRTTVVAKGNRQAEKLHNETTRLVRAAKQAAIGKAVYDLLTIEEQKVYRRGRNANPMHHAKGASLEEYFQATALETLCGYLFLDGKTDRLAELLRTGLELTKRRNGDPLL